MKCVLCKNGNTKSGMAIVTLARGTSTFVFKDVPAQICENCGEEYVDQKIASSLLQTAEQEIRSGVAIDVREYKAA